MQKLKFTIILKNLKISVIWTFILELFPWEFWNKENGFVNEATVGNN
jgi:hypothetical protein